jgi:asparagine synthase (glutamine-hydrolysing)
MCGIVGRVHAQNKSKIDVLKGLECILHRGPDGTGVYKDNFIEFAMCRLAIVDIATGQQPVTDASGNVVVIFNGEIYNYRELRLSLQKSGYIFKTLGDAEVIANLYTELGSDFPKQLNGMFAIALWDKRNAELFLVRDRVGKKPLWYTRRGNEIIFGSEIKSLLALGMKREVDFDSLAESLMFGYSNTKTSPFRGLSQVPPATILRIKDNQISREKYWDLSKIPNRKVTFEDAKYEAKELLESAVELRMNSEREFGVFLSGGLDSTLVANIASKLSGERILTFTAGFDSPRFDESSYAEKIARSIKSKHATIRVKPEPEKIIYNLASLLDKPFGDSSVIPAFLLAEEARKSIVVALGGDGGDEVFGGYDRYRAMHLMRNIKFPINVTRNIFRFLPEERGRKSRLLRSLEGSSTQKRYESLLSNLNQDDFRSIIKITQFRFLPDHMEKWITDRHDLMRFIQLHDLDNYLPNDLMYKADMASMGVGLELRSPLLDFRLVEFGFSLPLELKINGSIGKILLREILRDYMPDYDWKKRKQGFAIPIAEWLRGPLKEIAADLLFGTRTQQRGWYNCEKLRDYFFAHQLGRDRHRILWNPIMLEIWARNWLD